MSEPLLRIEDAKKSFVGIQALKGVSFDVEQGEILALVGENGAGKSTLAKIIAGVLPLDQGALYLDGNPITFRDTSEAQKTGIAIVLQEFNLIPHLSVAQNILLTHPEMYRGGFWTNKARMRKTTDSLIASLELDIHLDPGRKVMDLSVAEQQIVEIVKAIALNARLLILDEPSATLTRQEVAKLFSLMRRLRTHGVTLIFVSHRLDEILEISDRIVVLRDGSKVRELATEGTSEKEVAAAMVGRDVGDLYSVRERKPPGELLLEAKNVTRGNRVIDCSLAVHRGEVVGISGLVGAGRTELLRLLFGVDRPEEGQITIKGRVGWLRSPLAAIRNGIAMIPEDRKAHGLLVQMSVKQNITLSHLAGKGNFWINGHRQARMAETMIHALSIKTSGIRVHAESLSGGNQQKVVVAKWLLTEPDLIFMDEPTRGIDIGAKFDLYDLIDRLADRGMGIVLVSSELPEILALSDRILVMNRGRIVKELAHSEATEELVISYSAQSGTAIP
jgi:ABC-type sugar transport system ATPase subunit